MCNVFTELLLINDLHKSVVIMLRACIVDLTVNSRYIMPFIELSSQGGLNPVYFIQNL
jgi:hypothetical protein